LPQPKLKAHGGPSSRLPIEFKFGGVDFLVNWHSLTLGAKNMVDMRGV